jgi:biopolymer transport protein ExbD
MKIKRSFKPPLSLESVAMTDIIMNLFIFFFISFSLLYTFNPYNESKIKINLPKGTTTVQDTIDSPVIISIDSKNEIFISDKQISADQIASELTALSDRAKQNGIIIKADKLSLVDFFVKVLDATKESGIEKVGISIELEKK